MYGSSETKAAAVKAIEALSTMILTREIPRPETRTRNGYSTTDYLSDARKTIEWYHGIRGLGTLGKMSIPWPAGHPDERNPRSLRMDRNIYLLELSRKFRRPIEREAFRAWEHVRSDPSTSLALNRVDEVVYEDCDALDPVQFH